MSRPSLTQLPRGLLARPTGGPSPLVQRLLLPHPRRPRQHPSSSRTLASSRHPRRGATPPRPAPAPAPATVIVDNNSTPTSSTTTPQPPKKPRGIFYALVFTCVGALAGTLFRWTIKPPTPPPPGSPEDAYLVADIRARGEAHPVVRDLGQDPEWDAWDAYSATPDVNAAAAPLPPLPPLTSSPASSSSSSASSTTTSSTIISPSDDDDDDDDADLELPRLTAGPLSGARGLAFQRVFHHRPTGQLVSVVHFGPGLSGFPAVVHGGAIATVLDESLGRCAILGFPARTGVTARLELVYRGPTLASDFYVVRVRPEREGEEGEKGEEVVGPDGTRKSDRKRWVKGQLEDRNGRVLVEARALFVVPKGVKLKPLDVGF